jgi:hypothetical protein
MRIIPISLALIMAAGAARDSSAPFWRWPVPLDRAVSSNFCEYRDGRFHAGIDVRTFGSEGIPCVAISDGWISRMRAGSRGYGKALHLTLPDSTQIVYGHLSEFTPALEKELYAAQMKDTTFSVDIRFPPGRFRVSSGDTIAYSGMTGTTAPHLHLEVRDARDRPFDPFGTALAIPDGLAPSITRIVFVPLSANARVNGRCLPWGVAPRRARTGENHYVIEDTLHITGPVGVAATVSDRVNAESGRLAPHALEVYADDELRASLAMNRFSFDRQVEVDRLYDAGLLRAHAVTLFQIWNTGSSPFDTTWVDGGSLPSDSSRVYHGRVVARDAAGNLAGVEFVFVCGTFAPRPHENKGARRDLTVELDGAFFEDGFAAIPIRAAERAGSDSGPDVIFLDARRLGAAVRPLAAYADRDTAALWVAGLPRREDRDVRFPAHGVRLGIPAGALPGDVVVYARGADAFRRDIEDLVCVTRPVRVGAGRLGAAGAHDRARRPSASRGARGDLSLRRLPSLVVVHGFAQGFDRMDREDGPPRRVRRVPRWGRAEDRKALARSRPLVGDRVLAPRAPHPHRRRRLRLRRVALRGAGGRCATARPLGLRGEKTNCSPARRFYNRKEFRERRRVRSQR